MLLTDVFQKFINTCLKYFVLDPCQYFSSPELSWDAMLKMTKIELELISDIDMYLFVEKGMRGAISYIAKRFNKANNTYMQSYDISNPSKFIMYFDESNLHGWGLSPCFPFGAFKWLNQK